LRIVIWLEASSAQNNGGGIRRRQHRLGLNALFELLM